jgi:hypothetical protein
MKPLILLAAAVAVPAVAAEPTKLPRADAPPLVHMDLTATDALKSALKDSFDPGQINMLKSVAHQQAVTIVCTGFTVDKARFENEMNLIYDDAKGKPKVLTADAKAVLERKAALGFGMALGSQVAIAAYDEKAFCESAERERATLGFKHGVWVKQVRQ